MSDYEHEYELHIRTHGIVYNILYVLSSKLHIIRSSYRHIHITNRISCVPGHGYVYTYIHMGV